MSYTFTQLADMPTWARSLVLMSGLLFDLTRDMAYEKCPFGCHPWH